MNQAVGAPDAASRHPTSRKLMMASEAIALSISGRSLTSVVAPTSDIATARTPFVQDAIDNQKLVAKGKLTLPVLAIGGDHSYGAQLAREIGFAASNVRSAVINNSGHWIMEEQTQQAIAIIVPFLEETK